MEIGRPRRNMGPILTSTPCSSMSELAACQRTTTSGATNDASVPAQAKPSLSFVNIVGMCTHLAQEPTKNERGTHSHNSCLLHNPYNHHDNECNKGGRQKGV